MRHRYSALTALLALILLAACQPAAPRNTGSLSVLATTSIVADVVRQVGGESIEVTTLLPLGADPHSFQPAPRDMALVADASVIFANGAGLEEFLEPLIDNAGATARVIEVSGGIVLLDAAAEGAESGDGYSGDPHTWVDPNNVLVWVENIRAALTSLEPERADEFQRNADRYAAELRALDTWVRQQVESIPPENRILVTDHLVYGYFAERYGFTQVGALIPGFSTISSPSAQELAKIENDIRAYKVKAIFIGESVTPALGQRVAEDTGVQLVKLYHASLSEPDGDAPTYLDMIRYNVSAITTALK
ncbi:MAG: metal ABC transporter substrate-binding protein [Bellilinea sp.]